MTFKLLLLTYVVGGLTFLPLVAITALLLLWYSLPPADRAGSHPADDGIDSESDKDAFRSTGEGAASATFAVLRRYDFQAATAALKDASNAADKTDAAGDGQNGDGVSVYQSMYRSVFDRNRGAPNPLQEGENTATPKARAKSMGRVFYIVLRHGHLMLYDSAIQFEVRHVISLAHYTVSLEDDITTNPADLLESDVFTRRTAVVLRSRGTESGKKPYFLFGDVNIEKEDFYHALLTSAARPPIPRPLEIESMIKLQSALHSNSLSPEARALDALLGRVFLALHRTPFLEAFVRHKIETKMARIPKPAFIASMACHALDLGDAAPVLSNLRLKDINISGEVALALDLKYSGGVNLTVAAAAKLDLGPRFKTRMVSLLLAVVLQRLQGKMLLKIKPPPSNRIWFCFETMPDMELKIEPVVSSRQITYSFVLRAIEARIREAFAEGLVKPNWDDTPFFATQAQTWRGGIWQSENMQEEEAQAQLGEAVAATHPLSQRKDASSSMPTLSSTSGAEIDDFESVKWRSTANLVTQAARTAAEKAHAHLVTEKAPTARAPRVLRTPSFAPPAALVAVDDASADAVRANDASTPTRRRWIGRNAQLQTQKRDAAEEMRQVRDRHTPGRKNSSTEDLYAANMQTELDSVGTQHDPDRGSTNSDGDTLFSSGSTTPARTATVPLSSMKDDLEGRHLRGASTDSVANPQRKTILATTAAATAAARQWTWNAMASRNKGQPLWNRNGAPKQDSQSTEDLPAGLTKQDMQANVRKTALPPGPVGRGQPLPPPGKPLPGPSTKGLWSAAASGLGNIRKRQPPSLPPRRTGPNAAPNINPAISTQVAADIQRAESGSTNQGGTELVDNGGLEPNRPEDGEADGEFGPWMANDINDETNLHDQSDTVSIRDDTASSITIDRGDKTLSHEDHQKNVPPPLPRRRPVPAAQAEPEQTSGSQHDLAQAEGVVDSVDEQPLIDLDEPETTPSRADYEDQVSRHEEGQASRNHAIPAASAVLPSAPGESDTIDHAAYEQQLHAEDMVDDLSDSEVSDSEEMPVLDDDIQAIPAPVDAETEESGILDLAEDEVASEQTTPAETKAVGTGMAGADDRGLVAAANASLQHHKDAE